MSKLYDVTIRLPAHKLSVVIETLNGEGDLLSIEQVAEEKKRKRVVTHRVDTRGKTTGEQMIIGCLVGGRDVTKDELISVYKKNGLSAKSVSPAISRLIKNGRVVQVRKHVYKIAPKS